MVSDGDFYRVRPEFVDAIDGSLAALPSTGVVLPPYRGGEEGTWLLRLAEDQRSEFVHLDGTLVRIRGNPVRTGRSSPRFWGFSPCKAEGSIVGPQLCDGSGSPKLPGSARCS